MSEIETTEATPETTEAEAPKPRKVSKKAVKSPENSTERARAIVKAKLAAANKPNKDDMLDRLENGY